MHSWRVSEESVGQRLDVFIDAQLPGMSRSSIQKLIDQKSVTVDGKVEKSSYKVREGQKIVLDFDIEASQEIPEIKLNVLYEDDDCIVVDKPAGLLTHSKGQFNPEATVATFIESKTKGFEGDRKGIVHRLDRATSGVIIAAKTPEALTWLQKQFSSRRVTKTYVAVINGQLEPEEAVIDVPIERNPKKPQTFRAGGNGKSAVTAYKVIKSNEIKQLVELCPQTGRTHQLRVHLLYLGHPIVGDTLYGGVPADRLYLHAHKLEITLPSKERKVFTSAVPSAFQAIMK